MPSVTLPTPGIGIGNQAEQNAEHHADAERHVAEFRGRLHSVAKGAANFLLAIGRHQNANTIAELQHQIGRRHDIGIVAADMKKLRTDRQRQLRQRDPDHAALADEYADVVERGAILHEASGFELSKLRRRQ